MFGYRTEMMDLADLVDLEDLVDWVVTVHLGKSDHCKSLRNSLVTESTTGMRDCNRFDQYTLHCSSTGCRMPAKHKRTTLQPSYEP